PRPGPRPLPPPPAPVSGLRIRSPGEKVWLPGSTWCRSPLAPEWRKLGSSAPRRGIGTPWAASTSAILSDFTWSRIVRFSSSCTRLRKRWRLPRLRSLGLSRRSMKFGMRQSPASAWSAGLVDAHVPVDEPADLAARITARRHALDEFGVLLLGRAVLLRAEADDGQKILDLAEHALLDDFPQLLVARPGGVAP